MSTTTITREGSVNVLGSIASFLHGYSGEITIVRELVQNADDAPIRPGAERWIEFDLHPHALFVRNNSVFSDQDFVNIADIARQSKRLAHNRTIGRFGIGFVSVYQLTDTPIIRSAGRQATMMPSPQGFPIDDEPCDIVDYTEFELPYRRVETEVGELLDMPPISPSQLAMMRQELPDEAQRLLFFLRKLSRIRICETGQLVREIWREILPPAILGEPELMLIHGREADGSCWSQRWLRFTGHIPHKPSAHADRDATVQIVIPEHGVGEAGGNGAIEGRLYNYLPTEIVTGLPFHINGDFIPTTDRKGIDNDHQDRKDWNSRVIAGLGACLIEALPPLLKHFADDPASLYRRLPMGRTLPLVGPVVEAFFGAAPNHSMFRTRLGWRKPGGTFTVSPELRPLVDGITLPVMEEYLETLARPLLERLRVPAFTLGHLVARWKEDIRPGTPLDDGPDYLNKPEQLQRVYATLERHFAQTEQALLPEAPIFLDDKGCLWPANRCVRSAFPDVLVALADSGLHFWEPGQHLYLARLVPELTLTHLAGALRVALPKEVPLAQAPTWLNSTRKLQAVYRAMIALRRPGEALRGLFEGLPICVDRQEGLRLPRLLRMPGDAPILYDILAADPEPQLVLKSFNDDRDFRQLYADMGVSTIDAAWLIDRLERIAGQQPRALEQAHPCLNTREKLLRIYRFLRDRMESLSKAECQTLRHRIAIWLCQDGILRLAQQVYAPPSTANWPQAVVVEGLLDVTSKDRLGPLLDRLEIATLDDARFIADKLVPQMMGLGDRDYWAALKYLQSQLPLLRSRQDLMACLREAELFYDDDRRPARAVDLCFPTKEAQVIFGAHMRVPQIKRYFGEELPADRSKWPWFDLFDALDFNLVPPGAAVLSLVKALQAMPVREAREHIERLFRYLERHWESKYRSARITAELKSQKWLPAYNDDTQLYKPSELFPRMEQALVAHVRKVLGFRETRRPQAAIANDLGFPSVRDVDGGGELRYAHLVVEELLSVCKQQDPETPPDPAIYHFLDQHRPKGPQGLPRLRGKAVIYEKESRRYWKPEQIFLENHKSRFGSYRGYALNHPYGGLLEALGARKHPQLSDYRDVVQEIAEKVKGPVPPEEQTILKHAYTALASAKEPDLDPLRRCACVLTQPAGELGIGTGEFLLMLPRDAVLQPPQRIQRVLPKLPVARYDPAGEATLRELGVRSLDTLLHAELSVVGQHERATTISHDFAGLGPSIRRLLYQTSTQRVEEREACLWEKIRTVRAFELRAITVTYTVDLGAGHCYTSDPQDEAVHYNPKEQIIYLREGMRREERISGLADMLGQLLEERTPLFSLLRDLLRDPGSAEDTLDRNSYRQLPVDLATAPIDDTVSEFWLGAPDDVNEPPVSLDSEKELFPDPPTTPIPPLLREPGEVPIGDKPIPEPNPRSGSNGSNGAGGGITGPTRGRGTSDRPVSGFRSGGGGASSVKTPPANHPEPPQQPQSPMQQPNGPPRPPNGVGKRPAFSGLAELRSPTVPTDVDGLLERAERWAATQPPIEAPPPPVPTAVRPTHRGINPVEPRQEQVARFTLSFAEVHFGFLRLHDRARRLFAGQPEHVTCVTDGGRCFKLLLDWGRKPAIAYAQPELGQFFAEEEIPAGGIVYLERRHSDYRLYFNEVPHMVREVRIAWNDQGRVTYEILDAVEVKCETVDAVYRAEKRFEDKTALWLEAASKKSVFETLCDLFMASAQVWIHEDDLVALVMAERMVSASTVRQTLQKDCFTSDGNGSWRFVPQHLGRALQRDPMAGWLRSVNTLINADPALLAPHLSSLRQSLVEVAELLSQIEQRQQSPGVGGDVEQLVLQILAEPGNSWPVTELWRVVKQQIEGSLSLASDPQLEETLKVIAESGLLNRLRPELRSLIEGFRAQQHFERVVELCRVWMQFDPELGPELDRARLEAEVWCVINTPGMSASQTARALARLPGIPGGLILLKRGLYRDLDALSKDRWLGANGGAASVDAFYADIAGFAQGRGLLSPKDRKELDEKVLQRVRDIWDDLDGLGRIGLAVLLPHHAPEVSIPTNQLDFLRMFAKQRLGTAPIETLLVSKWAYDHTGDLHRTQRRELAELLAASHRQLEIWELCNKQAWLDWLDGRQKADLNSKTIMHERSRQQRLARFLDQLEQFAKINVFSRWLEADLLEVRKLAEKRLG